MTLPELSVRKHVFGYMFAIGIMLFGIVSYFRIGIDKFPQINFPALTIITTQNGATAEVIDKSITSVLEAEVNGIGGVDTIISQSSDGLSLVAVIFELEKDVDVAFAEVQAKVGQATRSLPDDTDPPGIYKRDISGEPIMWLVLYGDRTLQQLSLYAKNVVKKKLETITGISEITITGGLDRIIRIEVDMQKLASYGIGINELIVAFKNEHIQLPGGNLVGKNQQLSIKLDLEFHSIEQLNNLIIKANNNNIIRIKDVATVVDGLADYTSSSFYNSKRSLSIGITKTATSSAFDIEKELLVRLNTMLIPNLEAGLHLEIVSNDVNYIRAIVGSLKEHLYLGTFLTAIIVLLFLRNLTSTAIIAVAIPVSLLGAITVIYFLGYTFNTITLLALLLLIGVVVDDAIVVLENIYRKMEEGMNRVQAAVEGSNQIVFAVLAATLSLMSIFGPVIFMEGIIGRFFKSFAVVVTFGVIISFFVSIIVTPMLCSRFLKIDHNPGRVSKFFEYLFLKLEDFYKNLLDKSLNNKFIVILLAVGLFMSSFYFFGKVGQDFVPSGDESTFSINVVAPIGSSIYYTESKMREIETIIKQHKEVKGIMVTVGQRKAPTSEGTINVYLVETNQRTLSQFQLQDIVKKEISQVIGVDTYVYNLASAGGGEKLQFYLKGPNFNKVYQQAIILRDKLKKYPEMGSVNLKLNNNLPQAVFNLDRDKISLLGLKAVDIGNAISVSIGGLIIGKFNYETGYTDRYDIKLKAKDSDFNNLSDLSKIYIQTPSKELVRLDNLVTSKERLSPLTITKTNLQYSASFGINPEVALGDAMVILNKEIQDLPPGFAIEIGGEGKELEKATIGMLIVFALAIGLLYMVLASQFNSFIQPLYIMLAEPLAIFGGVLGLYLFNHSLNIFSMIGFVLLVGLVAKNAILLIDITNQFRSEGKSVLQALNEACPIRLRPILMTSLTVILSMLPAAIATGSGSELNAPLAVAVIGGMISSTVLTLVVIPVVYLIIESALEKRMQRKVGN